MKKLHITTLVLLTCFACSNKFYEGEVSRRPLDGLDILVSCIDDATSAPCGRFKIELFEEKKLLLRKVNRSDRFILKSLNEKQYLMRILKDGYVTSEILFVKAQLKDKDILVRMKKVRVIY